MHSWKRSCTGCTPRPGTDPGDRYSIHCTGQNSGHLPHGKHRFTSMNATSRGRFFLAPGSSGVSGSRSSLSLRLIMSIPAIYLINRFCDLRSTVRLDLEAPPLINEASGQRGHTPAGSTVTPSRLLARPLELAWISLVPCVAAV